MKRVFLFSVPTLQVTLIPFPSSGGSRGTDCFRTPCILLPCLLAFSLDKELQIPVSEGIRRVTNLKNQPLTGLGGGVVKPVV